MKIIEQLEGLRQQEAFGAETFPIIHQMISEVSKAVRNGEVKADAMQKIKTYYGESFLNNTLHGMGLLKPFGYAGDFLMIDRIYTEHQSESNNPFYCSWDKFFHDQAAARAVKNRKTYFKQLLHQKLETHESLSLLNIASGPARDLSELYTEIVPDQLSTTCVEMDANAIAYAKKLVENYSNQIEFVHKNIFKYRTKQKFDVIWSAGLFDYFDDKAFVRILSRFKQWLVPKGEIIIGNFNENHNPSRDYMEVFGEWFLIHRTEAQLIDLAIQAGFEENQISVGREAENINLFLHIKL